MYNNDVSNKTVKKPNIFEYTQYRLFLQHMYDYLKATQASFSFRYFAQKAGFTSPNFLKLVIDGKRNLTHDSLVKFAHVLKLNSKEKTFFETLVHLDQSSSVEEKNELMQSILKLKSFQNIHPFAKDQYALMNNWYVIALRELLAIPHISQDPDDLAKLFLYPLTSRQIDEGLMLLKKLGMIKKNSHNRWEQSQSLLSSGDEIQSISAIQYHYQMLKRAQDALTYDKETRDISSITMGLSMKNFKKLKQHIQKFRKELLALAESESDLDVVYQINFQLFPLTKIS